MDENPNNTIDQYSWSTNQTIQVYECPLCSAHSSIYIYIYILYERIEMIYSQEKEKKYIFFHVFFQSHPSGSDKLKQHTQ